MTQPGKIVLAIVFLGITLTGIRGSLAQTVDAAKAAMVKSAYLLNFAKFTTWPDGTFSDKDSPFVICVWGRGALDKSLEQVIKGKTVNGRDIVISRIDGHTANTTANAKGGNNPREANPLPEDILVKLNECHLLYISQTDANRIRDIFEAIESLNILTVGDISYFAEQGGMLGLVLRNGKITFTANPATIKNAGVKVSSKILKLAKIVQTPRKVMMALPRAKSFRAKLILLTTMTSTVAVLLVCGVFVARQQMNVSRLAIEDISTHAQVIAIHSAASLLFDDKDAGTETLTALAAEPDIIAAYIYSQTGDVFASFQATPEKFQAPVAPDKPGYYFDNDTLVLTNTITHNGEFLGTLTILYDMKPIYALAKQNIAIAAAVALVAIFISFGLAVWLNRVLAKPVAELDKTARIVSQTGDYSVRADKFSEDELGTLTDTFKPKCLKRYNPARQRWKPRPLELSKVNDDLQNSNEMLRNEMSERQRMASKLQHDAFHDALTQLPNRALLMKQINLCIERSRRQPDYLYAVIFIDLDNFKMINDSLGHDHGDRFLVDMAKRLVEYLRAMDQVSRCDKDLAARLGGDEFVILLDGIKHPNDTMIVAERIQQQISLPIDVEGRQMHTSASIGIAIGDAKITLSPRSSPECRHRNVPRQNGGQGTL